MRISSFARTACLAVWAFWLSAGFATAQLDDPRWPSRIIPPDAEEERDAEGRFKPPVVTAVCMQPGGPLLATTGDDHFIRVWNMEEGVLLARLEGHTDWVRTLAFSPDGRRLASAGNDRKIIMWNADVLEEHADFAELEAAVAAIAFSPDGRSLAVVGFDDRLRIYDTVTREVAHELACPSSDMRTVAWSPDGSLLAAAGRNGRIRVWSAADYRVLHEADAHHGRVRSLVFSPDGAQLVSCSEDRRVRIWRLAGGDDSAKLTIDAAKALALAFVGPDKLAVGGSDNTIRLWDLATDTEIDKLLGHTGSVVAMAHRDGRLVTGSYDTTVRVWSVDFAAAPAAQAPVAPGRAGAGADKARQLEPNTPPRFEPLPSVDPAAAEEVRNFVPRRSAFGGFR